MLVVDELDHPLLGHRFVQKQAVDPGYLDHGDPGVDAGRHGGGVEGRQHSEGSDPGYRAEHAYAAEYRGAVHQRPDERFVGAVGQAAGLAEDGEDAPQLPAGRHAPAADGVTRRVIHPTGSHRRTEVHHGVDFGVRHGHCVVVRDERTLALGKQCQRAARTPAELPNLCGQPLRAGL